MNPVSTGSIWGRFEHDPRDPRYAEMRASDRDRAVVHDVLATAYAEGRLDRDEFDERSASVAAAKTYAELTPPIRDLATDAVPTAWTPASQPDLQRKAQVYYGEKLRDALFSFLVPNLICWAIWLFAFGSHSFPWPLFVTIPTGLNLVRVATSRAQIVEGRLEKLERRQAAALEAPADGEEAPGPDGSPPPEPDQD